MGVNIVIGNIVSFIAKGILGFSLLQKSKKSMMKYQLLESILSATALLLLGGYSGLCATVLALVCNYLTYTSKLNKYFVAGLISCNIIVGGIIFNKHGLIGWLPVVAAVTYTLCLYSEKISFTFFEI